MDIPLVTASMAAAKLDVSIAVVCMWRNKGWIDPATGKRKYLSVAGKDGRSPLYRWTELQLAERDTGRSPQSRRKRMKAAA